MIARLRPASLLIALASAACQSGPGAPADGGSVRGADAAGRTDAAPAPDTGRAPDARPGDGRPPDAAGSPDAARTPDGPPADATAAPDGAAGSPPTGLPPPMFPRPGTGSCAPGCMELHTQYAEAVLRAASCTPAAASPCGLTAPSGVGCYSCPVWVNDLTELAPIYDRFNKMGCFGCFFDGAPGENRCHPYGCVDLGSPKCTPVGAGGTCTNMARERTCAAGVMTGTPCTRRPDSCSGGAHGDCFCSADSPNWTCLK